MNFLKFFVLSLVFCAGLYLTIQVVFFEKDILDLIAYVALLSLYKVIPLLFGIALTLCVMAVFGAFLDALKSRWTNQKDEGQPNTNNSQLNNYRQFFNSVYHYEGSYPVWKVQQEFRGLILSMKTDLPGYEYHFHNIDNYLSRVIDEVAKRKELHPAHNFAWDSTEELAAAKGDEILEQIRLKHTSFKKYS